MSGPVSRVSATRASMSDTTSEPRPAEMPPPRRHVVGFDEVPSSCLVCGRSVQSRDQWLTEDCYDGGPTKVERLRDQMFSLFFEHVPGARQTKMLAARALVREAPTPQARRGLEVYLDSLTNVFFGSRHPK
jgi:hypothetical protein